jgi:catechol 2,3-dioxygenase-like lactoylglutathione lyase family enzyme
MPVDLFAVLRVADYEAARDWYERLLGKPPTFLAHPTEAVWELNLPGRRRQRDRLRRVAGG